MAPFTKVRTDPLANARRHARIKIIGVKITVLTSAAFDVGLLGLKKKKKMQKDEQIDGLIVFCH